MEEIQIFLTFNLVGGEFNLEETKNKSQLKQKIESNKKSTGLVSVWWFWVLVRSMKNTDSQIQENSFIELLHSPFLLHLPFSTAPTLGTLSQP